jgi:carbonic anhydrase
MRISLLSSLLALAVAGSLALVSSAAAQEAVEWSYEGATGPENWAGLSPAFSACGEGSRQSPIDLAGAARRDVSSIRTAYAPSPLTLSHNGETVEVRSDLPQTLFVGSKPFTLAQMHFHSPAEHAVARRIGPLELHFVHQAADGERAVLGAIVRTGRHDPEFGRVRRALPRAAGQSSAIGTPVDLRGLLPASRRAFRYAGSLTTPPCSEGIRWLVLERPLRLSERQIEGVREVVEGNARPVQPRNGRRLTIG